MDELLFHPRVVHIPVALGVLMPLVAAGIFVAWWRGWLPRRAWIIAVALQAVLVGTGWLAVQSGEAEEERVEAIVAHDHVHEHEEAAEAFVWAGTAVLALMVIAGVVQRRRLDLALAALATVGTLAVLVLGWRTGAAGGRLVYEHGAAAAHASPQPPGPAPAARPAAPPAAAE